MSRKFLGWRPSHATVVAYLALFVALGGSSYAAVRVNGKNIKSKTIAGSKLKNRTITGGKIKKNTLTGTEIKESKLGKVPSATTADSATSATNAGNANTVGGRSASSLLDRCPTGTLSAGGSCLDASSRAPADLEGAMNACAAAGMRLPTPSEYRSLTTQHPGVTIDGNGEQTTVYQDSHNTIAVQSGISTSTTQGFARRFRCATNPTN